MDQLLSSVAARIFAALGLIAVGYLVWQWYSGDRIATTFTDLQQASNQLWPHYRNQPGRYGTSTLPTATIIALRALPDNDICDAALCNAFGGSWSFTGATNTLLAAIDNVGDSDCTRLVDSVPRAAGVTEVRVASSISGVASATANATPVTPDAAAALCVNGTNAIQFSVSQVN